MSLSKEKREAANKYLLEQISLMHKDAVKRTAENFGISVQSVYKYLNELCDKEILLKKSRGIYSLAVTEETFYYSIKDNTDEDFIYTREMYRYISKLPENIRHIWDYSLGEMVNNVLDHSGGSQMCIKVLQDYLNTTVFISDDGVGIFRNISDHFQFPDLSIAVEELFKGKLTTNSEAHSGEGIFFTSRIMDVFAALSDGIYFTYNKYDEVKTLMDYPTGGGTCIVMRLSNFSNKNMRELFDEYSDENGGFVKTRIPLRNIFDTYPVSRSQAKRLYRRFDSFLEVILDFEGVQDLGQGFAHELFVVFKKAHPEVKLNPINTNEQVDKMIYHVTNPISLGLLT